MPRVTPYNFSILLFSFCSFTLSLMIWLKREDPVGRSYLIYSSFVTIWGIGYSIMISENITYSPALLIGRIANAAAVFVGPTWLHFTWAYCNSPQQKLPKIVLFFYGVAASIDCFAFSNFFIPNLGPSAPFKNYPYPGPFYHLFTLLFIASVCLGFFNLIRHLQVLDSEDKKHHQILILAKLFGFIGGGLTFLPIYKIPFPQYGIFAMPLYPLIVAYLISRKRLFNIEELVQAAHQSKLEMMGILSASINHELRNPLYIIKNFAETLAIGMREGSYKDLEALQTKTLDHMDRIVKQSNKAMKIIGRLTAFARKKPDQDFKMEPVALSELLADLDILIRCEIEFHKIQITQEIPEDLPPVFADPAHLEEILLNLILNAYQVLKGGYQTEAQKEIRIQAVLVGTGRDIRPVPNAAKGTFAGQKIQITIQDNGPGISPEDLPNIFKPFYTKKQEGLGLGLYITKQLIEKNRGTIQIKSKPGQGAAFIMEFERAF